MDRLNFPQMVNKIIYGRERNKKLHNSKRRKTDDLFEPERYATRMKLSKERLNFDAKINNIVFNMHEKLRERQLPPITLQAKAKVKATHIISGKQLYPIKEERMTMSTQDKTLDKSLDKTERQNVNLSRMKTLCNEKSKKNVDKTAKRTSISISFNEHKRILAATQRKTDMQNLLREHKILQKNRQSLEHDIFAMRHSLDDLQHRVNNCLKQLRDKKTYCECQGLKTSEGCKKCIRKSTHMVKD